MPRNRKNLRLCFVLDNFWKCNAWVEGNSNIRHRKCDNDVRINIRKTVHYNLILAFFFQILNKHVHNMSSELSKQSKFDDSARDLELFLDNVQATLEPEDPNKSSDESVIRDRLDELKDACRQMRLKQQDLDSLNDLGYRLPLNKEDADRLHVINNRWLDLSSEATERQRGLQSCLLHQQNFNDKLEEWMLYLAQVEKGLSSTNCWKLSETPGTASGI